MVQHRVTWDPADPEFPHGTNAGYHRRCGCQPCADANFRTEKQRAYVRARTGGNYSIPVPVVAQHIERLLAQTGATVSAVSLAARVSASPVHRIRRHETTWVRRAVAERILTTTPDDVLAVPNIKVDARMTILRVRSMQALGWPIGWQSEQVGVVARDGTTLTRLGRTVSGNTARKIAALAARVGDTPGPSLRAATHARKEGWYPPAAYDDEGNLIPDAVDEGPATQHAKDVLQTAALAAQGRGVEAIAAEMGFTLAVVRTIRNLCGLKMARPAGSPFYEVEDKQRAAAVLEAAHRYEWEGFPLMEALAVAGIPDPTVIQSRVRNAA